MKAVILAAGRGSRLHPYTAASPKCLTVFAGETLVERQIRLLHAAGINDVSIVSGYMGDMLAFSGVQRFVNVAWETTNMVESLMVALPHLGDDVLVLYGDIAYEPRVLAELLKSDNEATVAVNEAWRDLWEVRFENPLDDAESLRISDDGRITDIGNPVQDIETIAAQFMGMMRFRGQGLADLMEGYRALRQEDRDWKHKRSAQNAYMTDLLMEFVLADRPLTAVKIDGGWIEIDTVQDYQVLSAMQADGRLKDIYDAGATSC